MQVNNIQNNNQSFGMAIRSNETVNKIIKSRIKNTLELRELGKIIDNAKNNTAVDVFLHANPDNKTISANICSTSKNANISISRSENFITRMFGGGIVGFIDNCSKIADKNAPKVLKADLIAQSDVLKRML